MGLKDKLKNRQNSNTPEANAIDLCDVSINAIFFRCVARPTTLPSDMETVYLFVHPSNIDFKDTTRPINFDKPKLAENYKKIQYMFGQLEVVHKNISTLSPDNSSMKYDGSEWNSEDVSLMQLYYLAIAAHLTLRFFPQTKTMPIFLDRTVPTLSPNDPNFPAWWEEHKAEWEG